MFFTYSACMNHANFERSHNYLQYILFIDTNLNAIYYIHPTTQALRTEKIPWVTFLLFCVRYCVFDFLSENLRHQRSQNVGSSTIFIQDDVTFQRQTVWRRLHTAMQTTPIPNFHDSFWSCNDFFVECYENNLMLSLEWVLWSQAVFVGCKM